MQKMVNGELFDMTPEEEAQRLTEQQAYQTRTHPDITDIDNLDKVLKVLALLIRQYSNALLAGTYTQKSVAQLRADFKTIYQSL